MSLARVLSLVAKDLRLGPRSAVLVWVLLMPVIITFFMQVVVLSLIEQKPRLGIADLGHSEITVAVESMEGIALTRAADRAELRTLVEQHDVDAGLVLAPEFDQAVRSGQRPPLELYVSGESVASSRLVLAITALDLVREIENRKAPVHVRIKNVGDDEMLPVVDIVVLCVVIFVLLITGVFAPAFLLVEERERRTLHAMLVTPVTMSEVLLAKALLGFAVAMAMSLLTLVLNGSLGARPLALIVTLAVAAITCNQIGLIYGTIAKDAKTLYSITKSMNVLLVGPLAFYFFPSWPEWIAKLFPTYWVIDPLYRVALQGAALSDVGSDLAVALCICVALLLPVFFLGRRLESKLA